MMAAAQQLSPFDRRRLDEHLASCERCSDFYRDMTMLAGVMATSESAVVDVSFNDAPRPAKSLKIVPAVPAPNSEAGDPVTEGLGRSRLLWMVAAGIACFACGLGTASYVGTGNAPARTERVGTLVPPSANVAQVEGTVAIQPQVSQPQSAQPTETASPDAGLKADLDRLRAQFQASQSELSSLEEQRQQNAQTNQEQTAELSKLRLENSTQQALISQVQLQLDQYRNAHAQDIKLIALRDDQLRQLTTNVVASSSEAAEDHRLNEASRLMGQRNLHVVDVYDNNVKGQRSPSFGRVFYSEGGAMMFVAFDLPGGGSDGKTTYHAWGQTEGSSKKPLQLGTFTQDGLESQRWVMRVNDARLLKQVDAVFITADHGTEVHTPSGAPMLYAYLRQVPNHP